MSDDDIIDLAQKRFERTLTDEAREYLAIRKEAAQRIDPETAEVTWWYAQTMDPYGVDTNLPDELNCIGREYFACAPGSEVWVWFGDLLESVRDALWEKHKRELAFPAGLDTSTRT